MQKHVIKCSEEEEELVSTDAAMAKEAALANQAASVVLGAVRTQGPRSGWAQKGINEEIFSYVN